MADFDAKLEGLEAIQEKLRKLPEAVGNRAMRRALRKGANVIRDAARNGAKRVDDPMTQSSQIWKNIVAAGVKKRTEKAVGGPMIRVGVLGGARDYSAYGEIKTGRSARGNPGGDTWHWRLVEFGTSRTAAKPFMRPAMEAGEQAAAKVVTAMNTELGKELTKLGIK